MIPNDTLFLYSAVSWVSYVIAEEYYGGNHFVWCSRVFDSNQHPRISALPPPTSTPKEIYQSLLAEVSRGDRHSSKIAGLRTGIIRGAEIRHGRAEITDSQLAEIKDIVTLAETRDFRPLILVISYDRVKPIVSAVPVTKRAHPLSPEFQIENLPRDAFDVIDFC